MNKFFNYLGDISMYLLLFLMFVLLFFTHSTFKLLVESCLFLLMLLSFIWNYFYFSKD